MSEIINKQELLRIKSGGKTYTFVSHLLFIDREDEIRMKNHPIELFCRIWEAQDDVYDAMRKAQANNQDISHYQRHGDDSFRLFTRMENIMTKVLKVRDENNCQWIVNPDAR